jgi:hypothetical protein
MAGARAQALNGPTGRRVTGFRAGQETPHGGPPGRWVIRRANPPIRVPCSVSLAPSGVRPVREDEATTGEALICRSEVLVTEEA